MSAREIFAGTSLILILFCASSLAKYSGGTGEPNDPYLIATPNDLNSIGLDPCDWDNHFKMTADINMAGYSYTTAIISPDIDSSLSEFQGTAFTGVFDGNGYVIKNLKIDTLGVGNDYLGIFGQINAGGSVQNLYLEDINFVGSYGSSYVGGICGYNNGYIKDCNSDTVLSGSGRIGGVCGKNTGFITNCTSASSITGSDFSGYLGCLCGDNLGLIYDSQASGQITCGDNSGHLGGLCGRNMDCVKESSAIVSIEAKTDSDYLGGLCGDNQNLIIRCHAEFSINYGERIGGLVGINWGAGVIKNCYAQGTILGTSDIGGICGENYLCSISSCYSKGSIAGWYDVGGICGNNAGDVNNCYSDIYAEGMLPGGVCGGNYGSVSDCYSIGYSEEGGGLCGMSSGVINNSYFLDPNDGGGPNNGLGLPLTEEQMKLKDSFVEWDFVNLWDIGENQTYPFLRTHLPSDINKDDETNLYDLAIVAGNWLAEE